MKKILNSLKNSIDIFLEKDELERHRLESIAKSVAVSIKNDKSMQIVDANDMAVLNFYGASCQMIGSSGEYLMYDDAKSHTVSLISSKNADNNNGFIEIILDETVGVCYVKTTKKLYEDTGYASLYPLRKN